MENTQRRRSGSLRRTITAVFAVAFVTSIISNITAFAAANLFEIQSAELSELSTTAEGSISSFDEAGIVGNVTFHKLGDFAKYTITLKNTDNKDHVIKSITDDNESPYISYIYDQHTNEQINAGENLVFVVVAKYSTTITDVNQRAQANNVKFFIHFTDLEEEIPIVPNTGTNPNTGDYIHFSTLSLVISAAGLTIISIITLKKHKKASKFIIAGIVTVSAIATTATVKAAVLESNSFTISTSYDLKDKLVVTYTDKDSNDQELVANYDGPANIPDQSKDGYTLTGWEDENSNPVDLTLPIAEDIKIHPVYRAHTYTVKFNGNGATGSITDLAMTYDETKTLPTNTFNFPGHTYTGWNTEADGTGTPYEDKASIFNLTAEDGATINLYAQWDAKSYTVTFNANGGEMLQSTKTVTYLQPYGELPTPVRYDYANSILGGKYSFKEWNTKTDGTGDIITSSSIYANTDDTTLYAIWNDRFTVTIYNGESETPTIASYGIDDIVYLNAQNVAGKQFLYWEVDGVKKSYIENYSMRMFQGKDLAIRAIYGSESDLESQQPGTYISDIYRQYSNNKIVVRSYSYIPDGYKIVEAGVIATLDANIANGTFDDQTATYKRVGSDNGNSYYFTWSKSNVTLEQTVYAKAYLKYKDADDIEHTIYGDLVTATLAE